VGGVTGESRVEGTEKVRGQNGGGQGDVVWWGSLEVEGSRAA